VAKQPEKRIAAGAATMVGAGSRAGDPQASSELERRMQNALKKSLGEGLDVAGQQVAVREAIERYNNGEPE
jgi:hypothetical protein